MNLCIGVTSIHKTRRRIFENKRRWGTGCNRDEPISFIFRITIKKLSKEN